MYRPALVIIYALHTWKATPQKYNICGAKRGTTKASFLELTKHRPQQGETNINAPDDGSKQVDTCTPVTKRHSEGAYSIQSKEFIDYLNGIRQSCVYHSNAIKAHVRVEDSMKSHLEMKM
jgi:hypothetical protein